MENKNIIQESYIKKLKATIAERYKKNSYFELKPIYDALDMAYCLGYDAHSHRFQGQSKRVIRHDGLEFPSVVRAAKESKINVDNLRKAIKSGNRCAGYRWKYAS